MLRRTAVMFATAALLVGVAWGSLAMAAETAATPAAPAAAAPPAPGGPGGSRDPAAMQARMDQFRQQMSDRMRQAFGATEDEWKVLQPKVEKVQTLSRQSRGGGGMGFMFGGSSGRGGPGGSSRGGSGGSSRGPSDRPQSDVEKAVEALQKVLENKDAKTDEIKTALAGVREARATAKKELEVAQKELREVLTVHQEAQCVSMGLLE